jgi:hypothetical protein
VEVSLNLLTQLTLHLMEDLSIPTKQVIIKNQDYPAGSPPPPPPPSMISAPVSRTKAYNRGLIQLELLLEVKERLLRKGPLPTGESVENPEQWQKEIDEIREKIEAIKKSER